MARELPDLWQSIGEAISVGATTASVEAVFTGAARAKGLLPAFRDYRGFPSDITISVNEEVINTLPSGRRLRIGDLVKVQIGLRDGREAFCYQAWTFSVGPPSPRAQPILSAAREALQVAATLCVSGHPVGELSHAMHHRLWSGGVWPTPLFVGHAIGTALHMEPQVPCVSPPDIARTPVLTAGTMLSLVVIALDGPPDLKIAPDGWNVYSPKGHLSVLLSHVVEVGDTEAARLTSEPANWPGVA